MCAFEVIARIMIFGQCCTAWVTIQVCRCRRQWRGGSHNDLRPVLHSLGHNTSVQVQATVTRWLTSVMIAPHVSASTTILWGFYVPLGVIARIMISVMRLWITASHASRAFCTERYESMNVAALVWNRLMFQVSLIGRRSTFLCPGKICSKLFPTCLTFFVHKHLFNPMCPLDTICSLKHSCSTQFAPSEWSPPPP